MSIFSKPDFEQMRRAGDMPRLIHWALYDKDRESSRAAMASLQKDVPALVEYLYDTAVEAQANTLGRRRKMLPTRNVKLLDEAVKALIRLRARSVGCVVDAVSVYDRYGSSDEHVRHLFLLLAFEVLEKIGRPSVAGLQELAGDRHDDVAKLAREALAQFEARGLVGESDDPDDDSDEDDE